MRDPVEHSHPRAGMLEETGVKVIYREYSDHSLLKIVEWSLVGPETLAFLDRYLRPATVAV